MAIDATSSPSRSSQFPSQRLDAYLTATPRSERLPPIQRDDFEEAGSDVSGHSSPLPGLQPVSPAVIDLDGDDSEQGELSTREAAATTDGSVERFFAHDHTEDEERSEGELIATIRKKRRGSTTSSTSASESVTSSSSVASQDAYTVKAERRRRVRRRSPSTRAGHRDRENGLDAEPTKRRNRRVKSGTDQNESPPPHKRRRMSLRQRPASAPDQPRSDRDYRPPPKSDPLIISRSPSDRPLTRSRRALYPSKASHSSPRGKTWQPADDFLRSLQQIAEDGQESDVNRPSAPGLPSDGGGSSLTVERSDPLRKLFSPAASPPPDRMQKQPGPDDGLEPPAAASSFSPPSTSQNESDVETPKVRSSLRPRRDIVVSDSESLSRSSSSNNDDNNVDESEHSPPPMPKKTWLSAGKKRVRDSTEERDLDGDQNDLDDDLTIDGREFVVEARLRAQKPKADRFSELKAQRARKAVGGPLRSDATASEPPVISLSSSDASSADDSDDDLPDIGVGAESETSEDFIDDDGIAPDQDRQVQELMPTHFRQRQELSASIRDVLLAMVYQILQPERDIFVSAGDFRSAREHARSETVGKLSSQVSSSVWTPDFKFALDTYHDFGLDSIPSEEGCDACGSRVKTSTYLIRLSGELYDTMSYQAMSRSEKKRQLRLERKPPQFMQFKSGVFCAERSETYHAVKHWEINAFRQLQAALKRHPLRHNIDALIVELDRVDFRHILQDVKQALDRAQTFTTR